MQSVSLVYLSSKRKKIINNFPITVITIFLSYARRSFSSAKSFGKQSHNWIGGNFHGDGTRELQNVSVIPLNIYFFVLFPFSSLIAQSFLSTNAVEFMNESETIWFIISLENENFTHTDAELEAHGNRLKSWWWPFHIKTFNYRNYFVKLYSSRHFFSFNERNFPHARVAAWIRSHLLALSLLFSFIKISCFYRDFLLGLRLASTVFIHNFFSNWQMKVTRWWCRLTSRETFWHYRQLEIYKGNDEAPVTIQLVSDKVFHSKFRFEIERVISLNFYILSNVKFYNKRTTGLENIINRSPA